MRSEDIERKTRFLSSQAEAEKFKHEAEIERLKNVELVSVNRELEQTKEALTYQAEHDHLTGLANRALFEQSLQQTIKDSELKSGQFAVLYLDLDGFKKINDTLGHDVGDQLLIEVATRLKNSVRMNDLVARMGGDEFTVLLNHIRELENVELLANIILASLKRPFELSLAPQPIAISASIGIAMYPRDGQDATELKKRADIAMYNVKYSGKNGLQMYAAN